MQLYVEKKDEQEYRRALREIGDFESVRRFLAIYWKPSTRRTYASLLAKYLRWLRAKGVRMNPDELVLDNLQCVYKSDPTDVATKRRHRAWLEEYVNVWMKEKGQADTSRAMVGAVVRRFYVTNDSPQFGNLSVSKGRAVAPPPGLLAEDVRKVLKALPLQSRVPLLLIWQSGCEVNRVLGLTWELIDRGISKGQHPLRLDFVGRKKHSKPYSTYLGRDSYDALRLWRAKWAESMGREPAGADLVFVGKYGVAMAFPWLNSQLRGMARRMAKQGLIENQDLRSWHSHYLRHSFKTECEHAGVKSGVVEFWMGHDGGIAWVYDHRDEVHSGDMAKEYLKAEPYLSLDSDGTVLREEYDAKERQMLSRVLDLERKLEALLARSEQPSGP